MISLSGRVPGRASERSRDRVDDDGGYGNFRGWRLGYLGFSQEHEFIGERARSVGARGAHTMPRRGQGVARARGGVAASRLFSVSCLDSVFVTEK